MMRLCRIAVARRVFRMVVIVANRIALVRRILPAVVIVATMAMVAGAADAAPRTVWLCNPGLTRDPCAPDLTTTMFSPSGAPIGVQQIAASARPSVDCFYVYPTVSDQPTPLANLRVDPTERSIALYQAARYSQYCRVYAPMYRQHTSHASPPFNRTVSFQDVRRAWHTYLRRYNKGRGFVLIGHSQGALMLKMLISTEVDPKPSVRKKLLSAILLGGNVTVRRGRGVGGDFHHIRACRSAMQLGCVVAYSTFDAPVPASAGLGRGSGGLQVLCTNPAALAGGPGTLDPIYPTQPFAPGSYATVLQMLHLALPSASTPWIEIAGAYRAQCTSAGGANVLEVTPLGGAPTPTPAPDATWGLHYVDANIALGNLVDLVHTQAVTYAQRHAA